MPTNKKSTAVRDIKSKVQVKNMYKNQSIGSDEVRVDPLDDDYNEERPVEIVRPPKINVTAVGSTIEDEELEAQIEEILPELKAKDSQRLTPLEDLIPREAIKVKFSKFVNLVANHDFSDVVNTHADEEIIMSSNLLTELAGTHDKGEEKKIPIVFIVGIAIGVVLTYIFFSK